MSPSRDLGEIAAEYTANIPAPVRYLMRGLGDDASTTELVS
jgi:hypothetical protein